MADFAAFRRFFFNLFHALLSERRRQVYKKATHRKIAHHKEHSKLVKHRQIATQIISY